MTYAPANFRPLTTLFKASLSRRIVLWVFASIVVIEAIILIPSVYRRERELLNNLRDISAARASGILDTKPPDASDEEVLGYISTAPQNNNVVLGGRLYANGREIGTFGEPPELTLEEIYEGRSDFLNRTTARYDATWEMSSLANTYKLVIRHDATGVQKEFYSFIGRISGLVVIISIFVTGATMVVLNRIVIMPIYRLQGDLLRAGDIISREELDPPPTFESLQTQRRDELGDVMTAFGEMVQQISEAIAERKEAERALARLAEIGELSSMIVHEVRNPLTTILMGLNSFKSMNLSDRANARLSLALDESQRLQRLLNEILMYARQQKLELTALELNTLVEELADPLKSMPSAENRYITISAYAKPVWIQGDKDKLKQVFINLVSNACEAIDEGESVTWTISRSVDSEAIRVVVHNGGPPIPADVLPKLTKPFFTTKSSGNGLGLAITKRIVEAHGGQLVIESAKATGTTVTVSLPSMPKGQT